MWDGTIPPQVTPLQGLVTVVLTGGLAAMVIPPGAYGGYVWNPKLASDQGISVAEVLYVNPIGGPSLEGFGSTVVLGLGETFFVPVARSTTGIWVNAATSAHRFTVVYWTGP